VKPPPNVTIWIRKVRHGQGIGSKYPSHHDHPDTTPPTTEHPSEQIVCIAGDNTNVGVSSYLRSSTIHHPPALYRLATMSFSVEDVGLAISLSFSN